MTTQYSPNDLKAALLLSPKEMTVEQRGLVTQYCDETILLLTHNPLPGARELAVQLNSLRADIFWVQFPKG